MIPRMLASVLMQALSDRPVVLLTGPRQSGKTTLVRSLPGFRYLTLDSSVALDAATSDPDGFVAGLSGPTVIDEAQRAPGLFRAIKAAIDRDRAPGRFLLTGSANALAIPRVAESLVGRVEILTLWPLSLREASGGTGSVCDALFGSAVPEPSGAADARGLAEAIVRGGYPEPIEWRSDRRSAWFRDYVDTVLQRDVRDISDIAGLTAVPRLLALLAARCSGLMNAAEVSRALGMPYATLHRYLALLEAVYLVRPIPAWSTNLGLRMVKSPKVSVCDTGLACAVLRLDIDQLRCGEMLGPLLEGLVAAELRKDSGWSSSAPAISHFREDSGREVDLLLEGPAGRIVGVEVKASASVTARDAAGLRYLAEKTGRLFHRGVILYGGTEVVPFAANIHAVPLSLLWGER